MALLAQQRLTERYTSKRINAQRKSAKATVEAVKEINDAVDRTRRCDH